MSRLFLLVMPLLGLGMFSCSNQQEISNASTVKVDSTSSIIQSNSSEAVGNEIADSSCNPSVAHQILLNGIQNNELKKSLACFTLSTHPFRLPSEMDESNALSKETVDAFFTDEENGGGNENTFANTYYPVTVFYQKDRIGVIVIHYYTPGAFGINNYFYNLYLFNYNGERLKMVNMGCNCTDTNMGSNDYYANSIDSAFIEEDRIRLYTKDTHATLVENDETEGGPFEDIKLDSAVLKY